jgi:hypothetical protein
MSQSIPEPLPVSQRVLVGMTGARVGLGVLSLEHSFSFLSAFIPNVVAYD